MDDIITSVHITPILQILRLTKEEETMRMYAVRMRYITDSNKRGYHTTKFYEDSDKAWEEAQAYQDKHEEIMECQSSLIHIDK